MANIQLEKGYTRIANEIIESLIKYEFVKNTGSLPYRICFFVIRKTYGYHKKMDIISLSQFQEGLNESSRSNLSFWLKYLVQAKLLVKIKKGDSFEYGFNKNYEEWLTPVQARALVQARSVSSAVARSKSSAVARSYKRKKEKTKETTEHSSEEIGVLIKSFEAINPNAKNFYARPPQRKACDELITLYSFERVKNVIEKTLPKTNKMEYMPTIISPTQLLEKWSSLEANIIKLKGKQKPISKIAFQ